MNRSKSPPTAGSATARADDRRPLPGLAPILFVALYFGFTVARSSGWVPDSWSLMPVVETAWLNFLVVVALVIWLRWRQIPLARIGLVPFPALRWLLPVAFATMAVDAFATSLASSLASGLFAESGPVARFDDVPGNLPLLLALLPAVWLLGGFGEEIFFRGFLLTLVAQVLGGSRAAWIAAVFLQGAVFGLVHSYQGPAQAITIGIGGIVYGGAFVLAGRNLWPVIVAHGLNDTLGLIFLYSGVIEL